MIQIILLVLGIFAAIRFPKLARARSSDFPGVDPAAFASWHSAEKWAAIWLIIATIGVFVLQLAGGFAVGFYMAASGASQQEMESAINYATYGSVGLFVAFLVVAGIAGSIAAKRKKAAGIMWPQK